MAALRCVNSSSTMHSLTRMASRTFASRATASSIPLDFLVPRWTLREGPCRRTTVASASRAYSMTRTTTFSGTRLLQHQACRSFSISPSRRATVCVRNPLKDEDGNDMMLEITPRAAKRLSDIMSKDKNPDLALRIQVESGGCHGFQYLMSLVTLPKSEAEESTTPIVREDDSIFQFQPQAEEETSIEHSPRIILDEPSLDLLKGSKVDFTMELIGSQFKITDNPAASSSCGCGTSFDVKI